MSEPQKVKQPEFKSLEEFITGNNNFYMFFIRQSYGGESRREQPVYTRFLEKYPEFAQQVFEKASLAWDERHEWYERLPWEDMYEAYKLMAELVFEEDCRLTK